MANNDDLSIMKHRRPNPANQSYITRPAHAHTPFAHLLISTPLPHRLRLLNQFLPAGNTWAIKETFVTRKLWKSGNTKPGAIKHYGAPTHIFDEASAGVLRHIQRGGGGE